MMAESRPKGHYLIDETGKRIAVLLDLAAYERLLQDLHDLAVVAERRDKPVITPDGMRQRLARPGAV